MSSYLPKRSLKQALCSKPLINDPIFMSKHATVVINFRIDQLKLQEIFFQSPRHTFEKLRFITQDDYHYWHERDWFVLTEYAKTFKVFKNMPYHDKVRF